jgi:Uma2 family endonuclease
MTRLSTAAPKTQRSEERSLPPLEEGDHLDQPTFHARYEAMPEGTRAELIGGIVFMPGRVNRLHGHTHAATALWLSMYEQLTPGLEGINSSTLLLGPESEPQPDLMLLIVPEKGGQTRNEDDYIAGAPELVLEIASSTDAIDLHRKRDDYQAAGVKEYVVVVLRQARVIWLVLQNGHFEEMQAEADGSLHSKVFPGLWLDPAALLQGDSAAVLDMLRQGLASPEHAVFVAQLAAR